MALVACDVWARACPGRRRYVDEAIEFAIATDYSLAAAD